MKYTSTSYSLAIMYKDSLYGVRDPIGNRPLAIGKLMLTKSRRESVGEYLLLAFVSLYSATFLKVDHLAGSSCEPCLFGSGSAHP